MATLPGFFPFLSSTPIVTCLGVIALLWLTTVANFGGPSLTGRIGAITVWGVIIPVGLLSIIGWLWFSRATFAEAWNPNNLTLLQGMGSSISLTLWAFLGMESAAQNSDAVENPKRNVPLACMFGTLGAAVIYILSTTVIQGIVPNPELAKSTGPFALAYAKMFNPTIGSIIMALAVMACLGSLLGWQFTIAQTGKSAAEQRMFPAFFTKVNKFGAPITGMIVLGVVQSLLALSTISPTLSKQFSALVNLAVVTNVIPYIISLSALMVMMRAAKVPEDKYRFNAAIAVDRHALQHLCDLCLGQGCRPRRHADDRDCIYHLGFHRRSFHQLNTSCRRTNASSLSHEEHDRRKEIDDESHADCCHP